VADALADHPGSRVRSLSVHATDDHLWRVDHATGTPAALDDIEAAFLDGDYYADCLATEHCGATQTTRVLDHTDDTLVLYTDWEPTPVCASVPHIARDHLGESVLFETRHEGRHYTWRLIHSAKRRGRKFFDALRAAVGDAARTELLKTASASGAARWVGNERGRSGALSRAGGRDQGRRRTRYYYESPREVDVGELADHLDVPRSTLTYRLRRAEERLAKAHVVDERVVDASPASK